MTTNSDLFNLQNWNLTIPVDATGGIAGVAIIIPTLTGYEDTRYFYDAPDGAMVFRATVDGATTSGTKYARSELRELTNGKSAAWNLATGGTMTATVKIDQAPVMTNGAPGKMIVGQIHGKNDELVRLYWDNKSMYFANDLSGANNTENKFYFKNGAGLAPSIDIGEKFSYQIDARGDTLNVIIYADGDVYTSTTQINSVWQTDTLYFKAGVYLGVDESTSTGAGQVSFYALDMSHTPGYGLGGISLPPVDVVDHPPVVPVPDPVVVPPVVVLPDPPAVITLVGTNQIDKLIGGVEDNIVHANYGDDTVYGKDGNDTIYGDDGNDLLYGDNGNDILDGGVGNDTLYGGIGNDKLYGMSGNDKLYGDSGDDVLDGGVGNDVLDGGASADTLYGGTGVDSLNGGSGNDLLYGGSGNDTMEGGTGNDSLYGESNDDILSGGSGNDILDGGTGIDRLYGGDSSDTLIGGSGDDFLYGGLGKDTLTGGSGVDTFVFTEMPDYADVITDFQTGNDHIDIDALLGAAGVASLKVSGGNYGLYVDADGAGSGPAVLVVTFQGGVNPGAVQDLIA